MRRFILRYLGTGASLVAAIGALAASALADGPSRDPLGGGPIVYPAGTACSFTLLMELVINKEYVLTFPADENGDVRAIATGRLVDRFTNLDNGHSLELNASGPGFATFHADGSIDLTLGGLSSEILSPTDVPPGPIALLNSGRLSITITTAGQLILHDQVGHSVNICSLLA